MVTSSHVTKGMTPQWALVKMVLKVWVPKKRQGPNKFHQDKTLCQTVRSTNDNADRQTRVYVYANKKHIYTEKQDISNKKILNMLK